MFYVVEGGQVIARQDSGGMLKTVYCQYPKATRVTLSPDGKHLLIVCVDGSVKLLTINGNSVRAAYSPCSSYEAIDAAWSGNNSFQVVHKHGCTRVFI